MKRKVDIPWGVVWNGDQSCLNKVLCIVSQVEVLGVAACQNQHLQGGGGGKFFQVKVSAVCGRVCLIYNNIRKPFILHERRTIQILTCSALPPLFSFRSYEDQKDYWVFSILLPSTLKQHGNQACSSLFRHETEQQDAFS